METQIAALRVGEITHNHFLPETRWAEILAGRQIGAAFVTRDPRDALLSMLNYARAQNLPAHVSDMLVDLSDEDALLFLLDGAGRLIPFADYYDAYYGWLSMPGVEVFRFEDIVGPRGGGDNQRQLDACVALAKLAGIEANDARFEIAWRNVFNPSAGTFFRGQVGEWRKRFTSRVLREFDRKAGWLPERWGYST
ncbi:hypothetical protein [Candidatus Viadribacter manganicus]|uniref:hypothetical protein n=1 Tax=Candidatus Viadribacter manganicus TaxID=1759059 RepID=UPI0012EA41D8|nr:hypothetical protein [Candidatus Viadribacter manganicus]